MAQVKKKISQHKDFDERYLLRLAGTRTSLPKVPLRVKYEEDVDLLCIRFESEVDPSLVDLDDEEGVIGIYRGRKLIGVEILDITNGLQYANPR